MEIYTEEEMDLINSLNKSINNIDNKIVDSIINKMIANSEYEELIAFLNNLNDFGEVPKNIIDKLIDTDNKECISTLLENESILYFLTKEEKKKLKDFLNVSEVNIKLDKPYDYYYQLLFKQGVRNWHTKIINNTIEHTFIKYNKQINIKLKEVKDIGVVVSCIIYSNYNLPLDEQTLRVIDYINEFGLDIERDINNKNIIKQII